MAPAAVGVGATASVAEAAVALATAGACPAPRQDRAVVAAGAMTGRPMLPEDAPNRAKWARTTLSGAQPAARASPGTACIAERRRH